MKDREEPSSAVLKALNPRTAINPQAMEIAFKLSPSKTVFLILATGISQQLQRLNSASYKQHN